MRQIILMLTFGIFLQLNGFAQRSTEAKERIESMRIAHLSNAVELSSEQAQVFWPLYNEFKKEEENIKKIHFKGKNILNLSEEEATQLLTDYFDEQQAQLDLQRAYVQKFRQVLSSKQLIQLTKAEKEFNRRLLKKLQERRSRY